MFELLQVTLNKASDKCKCWSFSVRQMEISELEEQKTQVEQQVKQLKEALDKLQTQIQRGGGGGGWSSEQERR